MIRNITQNKNGFTLVEALVALSILIVGIISGFILVTKALYDVTIIQDRLTASFLAQESIEFVRQIRDSNYLSSINGVSQNWSSGLPEGRYIVYANLYEHTPKIYIAFYEDKPLYYHPDTGLYDYTAYGGQKTSFKREINLNYISDNELKIQSIVTWTSRNINFTVGRGAIVVEEHLFNWLPIE